MRQLREQGVESLEEVKKSYLEGDGRVSIIKRDSNDDRTRNARESVDRL